MIANCETCDRKQVPCKSCQVSQRAICYVCQGDVADPYGELEGDAGAEMRLAIKAWLKCPADKRPTPAALGQRISEIAALGIKTRRTRV